MVVTDKERNLLRNDSVIASVCGYMLLFYLFWIVCILSLSPLLLYMGRPGVPC